MPGFLGSSLTSPRHYSRWHEHIPYTYTCTHQHGGGTGVVMLHAECSVHSTVLAHGACPTHFECAYQNPGCIRFSIHTPSWASLHSDVIRWDLHTWGNIRK